MSEEVNKLINKATSYMQKAVDHLENELTKVRAGRANPNMLDGITVEYYGSPMPINQVANVSNVDARTLAIQPWEKNMLQIIEKALFGANLGITPQNDGEIIRLNVPPLTEERRKSLVKQSKGLGEEAKVSIRNVRKDANQAIKKLVKDGLAEDIGKNTESKVQDLTNKFVTNIDKLVGAKETDIMKI